MDSVNAVILLVLAGVVLVVVLVPLRRRPAARPPPPVSTAAADAEAEDPSLLALREIEQDRAMGRLSEADYAALRARYEAAVRARPAPADAGAVAAAPVDGATLEERAEVLVRRWREARVRCPTCGVRPEPEAAFCSRCGRYLRPCPRCGRAVEQPGARYCPACGAALTS